MHDLIKITSRKSSTKIITFYFRIPLFSEYNASALELNLIQQLDQKPPIKYTFAFKRKVSDPSNLTLAIELQRSLSELRVRKRRRCQAVYF
jgi:hypothetical protein